MAKYMVEVCSCPTILWKVGLVSDEIGYLAKEIAKKIRMVSFFLFVIFIFQLLLTFDIIL